MTFLFIVKQRLVTK